MSIKYTSDPSDSGVKMATGAQVPFKVEGKRAWISGAGSGMPMPNIQILQSRQASKKRKSHVRIKYFSTN